MPLASKIGFHQSGYRSRVACSKVIMAVFRKGTYVRSLAHDIGCKLNCGGHLAELRRTRSGTFSVDQAVPLDALLEEPGLLKKYIVSTEAAVASDRK